MKYIIMLLSIFYIGLYNIHAMELQIVGTEWPPYDMLKEGEPIGLSSETIISVLKKMGVEFSIKFYPWKRAVMMVKKGKADGLLGVSKNVEREKFLYYPATPIHQSRYVFFIRKEDRNKLKLNSYNDLKPYRVGVTAGYSYTQELWNKLTIFNNYESATTDLQNLKKLVAGRIDYFPCDLANGIYLSKTTGDYDHITFIDYTITQKNYYLAFSKESKYPDLMMVAKKFDNILKVFKQTKEYSNLRSAFFK